MADREWTADCVADHFEEAFRTLRKLPPVKAQGYFNTWPDIVRTSRDLAARADLRLGALDRGGGAQAGLVSCRPCAVEADQR